MPGFSHPEYLLLICLVPTWMLVRRSSFFRRIEFPLTLGDWNGIPFRWSSPVMALCEFTSGLALVLAFVSACVALAGPVLYRQERVYSGTGTSVIFALDISPSMAAKDIGNARRLDLARQRIHEFVNRRGGDLFGLVALGSDAALLVPPTSDHRVFIERLDALAIGELGDGTALGMGLAVSAAHLVGRHGGPAAVVLLTDGENNTGAINPKTAADIFPAKRIGLFVLGVGTKGEVPIEYVDPLTGTRYSGTLQSDFNETALREIADRGGGTYVSASSVASLDTVFAEIGESVPTAGSSWTKSVEEPIHEPFIIAALSLSALAWFLRRLVMGAVL